MQDVIPGVLRGILRDQKGPVGRVRAVWAQLVGEATARRTRVAAVEGGVLVVEVSSAALKHHLKTFGSDDLLERLHERLPDLRIRTVRYRVGRAT